MTRKKPTTREQIILEANLSRCIAARVAEVSKMRLASPTLSHDERMWHQAAYDDAQATLMNLAFLTLPDLLGDA